MRKIIVALGTVVVTVATFLTPAFADVLRPSGQTTGQPYAVESNTGSTQGLVNRSSTGTLNKFSHDGYMEIV